MDEDEEVILEGSSLYNHLKETGYEDFEVAPIHHENCSYEKIYQRDTESTIWILTNYFTELFPGVKKLWSIYCGENDIEKEVLRSLSLKLLKAKFLDEEDLLILENLSPEIQELSSELLENSETLEKESWFPDISWNKHLNCYETFYLSLPLVLFTAVITMSFMDVSVLSALFSIFLIGATVVIFRAFQIYMLKSCLMKLNELLCITLDANQVSAKCVRYLFEMDIFKRGLGQKNISNAENNFEESLCYGLSRLHASIFSYFKTLREEIMSFSSKTSDFGNIHILFNKRFDAFDCSVCKDNESTFVKAKTERIEVSSAISAFWTETFLLYETLETLRLFNAVRWKELDKFKHQIQLLEKNLNLSRNFWLEEKSNLKHLIDSPKSYEKLKTDVTGAVNTLSIKCRLLAYYSVFLQDSLLNCENDNFPFDFVRENCKEIGNYLLSCNASLEDILERTENLYSAQFGCPTKQKHELNETQIFDDIKTESTTLPTKNINLNDLEPRVIQDEVFEAVVVKDNQPRSLLFDEDEEFSQFLKQEKQMKKKQKDRCRRVLQEIQPILQKRRQIWEERESKALDRMKNVIDEKEPDEPSLSAKESDSGVSSPLEIPKTSFENKEPNSSKLMYLYGSSVNSNLAEPQDCDGYDSEEERLLLYRRVKKELEEDEERRRRENSSDTEDEEEENYLKRKNLKLPLKFSSEKAESESNHSINNLMSSSTDFQSDLKESHFSSKTNVPVDSGSFSCGESSDDDVERVIDWSSCGFRNRKSQENENQHIKDGFTGFSLPTLNDDIKPPTLAEEVFGGFGEGESDEEKSSNDSDSLIIVDEIKK